MDILWKVIYTLLNADLSTPNSTVYASGTLGGARTTSNAWDTSGTCISAGATTYNRIRLAGFTSTEWDDLPDSGTVVLGSGSVQESINYTSKGYNSGGGYYYLNFNSRTFANNWSVGNSIVYSFSGSYPTNYPTNNTEAMSADFLNNLGVGDDNTLLARLGLMTFTTNSNGRRSKSISGTRSRQPRRTPPRLTPPTRTSGAPSGSMPTQAEARRRPRPCAARRPSSPRRTTPARYAGRTSPS